MIESLSVIIGRERRSVRARAFSARYHPRGGVGSTYEVGTPRRGRGAADSCRMAALRTLARGVSIAMAMARVGKLSLRGALTTAGAAIAITLGMQ